jgi:UDP-N-acetylmuramoylalanine--D-glutamate ligase
MNQPNKNMVIGVWGFGVMGKSAAQYFCDQGYRVQIMDQRKSTVIEQQFLQKNNIRWYDQEKESNLFFNSSDCIIPSPGVNINSFDYATYMQKFVTELDFFYDHFSKPIIAITGTVGKTSVTHLLSQLCEHASISVAMGGNIGIPTFDLLSEQDASDYAVLEVSSFQLMHNVRFAPQLAIWTNLYPNHLDHHATPDEYFYAKHKILRYQDGKDHSIVALALRNQLPALSNDHTRCYFSSSKPSPEYMLTLGHNERLYYVADNYVVRYAHAAHTPLIDLTPELVHLSFTDNILILVIVCDLMNYHFSILHALARTAHLPDHRTQYLGTINDVTFYNDSKSTTTVSTLAAVNKLKNKSLHLFLGGLSKGVDRAPFIAELKDHVKYVYCFGREAPQLYEWCISNAIHASLFDTLEIAFDACIDKIGPGDCVLLSPAGSSYDLYENYEKRGEHFKQLFEKHMQ